MNDLPLAGLSIIDFSQRLPGPFCGKILADLGANVTKIEDHLFPDSFLEKELGLEDQSFKDWYEILNAKKSIRRFNFDLPVDQEKIFELVKASDAVIMGLPIGLRKKLNLNKELLQFNKPLVVIDLLATRSKNKSMHDLNALAASGVLSLYLANTNQPIVKPPFLPFAGISFGHKIATDLLANWILAIKKNQTVFTETYMDEATNELLGMFWPLQDRKASRTSYLHNGKYPCYAIYQTKDNRYVALAAVEKKFWLRFCEIFQLDKNLDRFQTERDDVFQIISKKLSSFTQKEIDLLTANHDLCLSPIM